MPSYAKFMKDILAKKRKLEEYETVALTQESSQYYLNKLPPKLKDPGSFTIPCTIGEARPTTVTLLMADRSITHPEGKIEDVLVRVDKFIFPADFIVLVFEADREVPIILGRAFLATGRALIDVEKGDLTMRVNDEQVTFNVLKAMKYHEQVEECASIDTLDAVLLQQLKQQTEADPLNAAIAEECAEDEEEIQECLAWMNFQPVRPYKEKHFESLGERAIRTLKPSIEESPIFELKPLPQHLKYAFLGD
ncbi:uncharacterized protein LOC133310024 [Gastrolobium bilobum]|uniref:uncharacterized protein LOC133310024 n=1 Tax=Gastrolobium bilobum TaxID=150636 RepID=UPI002AAFB044|nr:uncharacterized protein LOC133310024 [Gastrolobium bilobum]